VDAERLQGFPANWTKLPASELYNNRDRWRLIGNAVSVPVAKWIARRILAFSSEKLAKFDLPPSSQAKRHNMAWGGPGLEANFAYLPLEGPASPDRFRISKFGFKATTPLSFRAASGFLNRLLDSPLKTDKEFVRDLTDYCDNFSANKAA
jgi:DNA (cytosine-5)-methyltransferase 1